MDDTTYYVTMDSSYLPVQYLTRIKPVIHAPASARRGSAVTVTGTGIPGQHVQVAFTTIGGSPVTRDPWVDANGNWFYRYTATLTIAAFAYPAETPGRPCHGRGDGLS